MQSHSVNTACGPERAAHCYCKFFFMRTMQLFSFLRLLMQLPTTTKS
jgi:hypothetical protein